MRIFSFLILIACLCGELTAQQFDLHQSSFKYDFDTMGKPSVDEFKPVVVFSIDNNGVILDKIRSNYYYRSSHGQFSDVMHSKNPKLGFISDSVKETPTTIQPYYIEKKMLGNSIRRHYFTDDFDARITRILTQKTQSHLIDSIGFKDIDAKEVFVLDESYFKTRIYFQNMRRQNALYLTFASTLLTRPIKTYGNVNIDLIFGLIENHKGQEYLHIELILNKENQLVFRTAINVFQDWSNIDVDKFSENNFTLNEIVSSLFHEIYSE